jgi:hypothetical protein
MMLELLKLQVEVDVIRHHLRLLQGLVPNLLLRKQMLSILLSLL